ncbi:MAG: hypothetical protein IPJ78_05955 [Gemmatimonadetes bacterium]|nr:hypothetical protein [Gemmatimonadota bacterium]
MRTRLLSRAPGALLLGLILTACAKDAAAPAPVAGIIVVQGADQSAQVGKVLPTAVILRAIDSTGNGIEGRTLTLQIGSGGGAVTPTSAESDASGEVLATWTLGPSATTQSLIATAPGLEPVIVAATGLVPTQVVIAQGNNQTARAGVALPVSIVVRVLGANNVPMVGIPVAVQVTAGGGSFTPQTASTNATGEVTLRWTTGAVAGANTASIQVWTLDPVTISATGTP